jgi:hypothetical protein
MEFIKKFKIGILASIIIIAGIYHLYVDDELNPEAKKWIEHYSKATDLEGNAFIGLIALSPSSAISTVQAKELYKAKLAEITKGSLDYLQQLKYPNVSGLPDIYGNDEVYFCEFNKENCLIETAKNRDKLEKVIQKFSKVTDQYRALSKLTNFQPLNSIVSEPDWDQLGPIHRLTILEVYFHILDNNLELAAVQLSQLISLDRSFLSTASDAIFHVMPIVNFKLYYQPMFIELKQKGFQNWEVFGDSISPLTFEEVSMNRMWLMMFAQGTRALQFKYIADRAEDLGYSLYGFQAQLKYKENVTLNSMFEYQKLQLIPDNAKKENLVSLVEIADANAKEHSEMLRKAMDNLIWFTVKNYRNIVGAYLEVTAMPKFLNLYDEKFKLDLRLLLLNIMIDESNNSLEDIVKKEKYRNSYTGEAPKLLDTQVCYKLSEDKVCIELQTQ